MADPAILPAPSAASASPLHASIHSFPQGSSADETLRAVHPSALDLTIAFLTTLEAGHDTP